MVNLPPDDPMKQFLEQTHHQRRTKETTTKKTDEKTLEHTKVEQNRQQDTVRQTQTNYTTLQDTIKPSERPEKGFGPGTESAEKPALKAPEQHEMLRSGKMHLTIPQAPQVETQTLKLKAMAENAMQDSTYQGFQDAAKNGKIPKGVSPEKFMKQVATALTNPNAKVPKEAKALAEQILSKSVNLTAEKLNISPEEAKGLIQQAADKKQNVSEFFAGNKFNDSFEKLLQKNVSPKYHSQLNFAKNNPGYEKFLPDNLKGVFNKLMKAATSQTQHSYNMEGSKIPYDTEKGNAKVGAEMQGNFMDALFQKKDSGDISEKDFNRLQNLYFRPDQNLPENLKDLRNSMVEQQYNQSFTEQTGIKDPSVEQEVFKSANEFVEEFSKNLDNIKPPLKEDVKKEVKEFLTNRDPTKISKEGKKAFDAVMRQTSEKLGDMEPPSPFTMRKAELFQAGLQKGLQESNLPEDVQKRVLQDKSVDPQKFKDLPNAAEITEQLTEISEKGFAEMRNALSVPFGVVRDFGDHRQFLNTLKKAMKSEKISPSDQKKILEAVKQGNIPPELQKLVEKLLGKVKAKVAFDRGLPEDWSPNPEMLVEVDASMSSYQANVLNEYGNMMDENMEVVKQTIAEIFGEQALVPNAGAMAAAGAGQTSSSFSLDVDISIGNFIKVIGNSLNKQREMSTAVIISNSKIQSELQAWQRDMNQAVRDKSYKEWKKQHKEQEKEHSGIFGGFFKRMFRDIKLGFELIINAVNPMAWPIEAALIEQIVDKGWNDTAAEGVGGALIGALQDAMDATGISGVGAGVTEVVVAFLATFMSPFGPLISFHAMDVAIPDFIDSLPVSQDVKDQMNIAFKAIMGVIKLSVQIALIVVLFIIPGTEEVGVEATIAEVQRGMRLAEEGISTVESAVDAATTVEDLEQSVVNLSDFAQSVSQLVEKVEGTINEITEEISDLNEEIQGIKERLSPELDGYEELNEELETKTNELKQLVEKREQAMNKVSELNKDCKKFIERIEQANEKIFSKMEQEGWAPEELLDDPDLQTSWQMRDEALESLQSSSNKIDSNVRAFRDIGRSQNVLTGAELDIGETQTALQEEATADTGTGGDGTDVDDTGDGSGTESPPEGGVTGGDTMTAEEYSAANEGLAQSGQERVASTAAEQSEQAIKDLQKEAEKLKKKLTKSISNVEKNIAKMGEDTADVWKEKIKRAKNVASWVVGGTETAKSAVEMGVGIDRYEISKDVAALQKEISKLQGEISATENTISLAEMEYQGLGKDTQRVIKALEDQWKMEQGMWAKFSQTVGDITGALLTRG